MAFLLTRRNFAAGLASAAGQRPNLLFLIADDHAGYALGAAGDRLAQTPHLDGLAAEGTRFARAYCNSPVCTASRQSFFTGQLPHAAGVTRLPTRLDERKPTLAKQLKAAGYATAVFGKMHFNQPGRPGLHGFDYLMTESDIPKSMPAAKAVPGRVRTLDANRGPSHKGDYRWLIPARERMNANTLPWPRHYEDMPGTFVARRAVRYLEEHRSKPFALWVSFPEPHAPHRFPIEFQGRFEAGQMRLPQVGPEDEGQIPLTFRGVRKYEFRGGCAAYYTAAAFLDRNVGEVLDGLKRLGLAENTLVVYMADHGFSLGHHGRWEKHCGYDPALHVPLLMRWPGRVRRGVAEGMVESVDVPATILDLLQADPFGVQHGRSLRPELEGKPGMRREWIFSEYLENEEAYVRTERWKFIYCSGKRRRGDGYETDEPTPGRYVRLFDLLSDPGEFRNVAGLNQAVVRDLGEKMLTRFRATHLEAADEPSRLTREEALDWYLRPRDV